MKTQTKPYLFKKLTAIGVLLIAINNLSACNTFHPLGIPRVDIENNLGNSQIGKVLTEANVTTGTSIYNGSDAFSHINQKDTKLYRTIVAAINNAKQKGGSIEQTLDSSNLGVVCKSNQCRYHGHYTENFSNLPKVNTPTGKRTRRGDVVVTFNPNNFEQTYNISFTETQPQAYL